MDALTLNDTVKYLADAGAATLSINERMQLQLSLAKLQNAFAFQHLFLWGKIQGKLRPFERPFCPANRFRSRVGLLPRRWHELPRPPGLPGAPLLLVLQLDP